MQTEPFQEVISTLVDLGAERVLILEGPQPFRLRAAYGIVDEQPWDEQVSLALLEQTIGEGTPLMLGDAQSSPLGERWSLLLNQVRSVLCVPFWTPSSRIAGILYADTRSKAGVFSRRALQAMQQCARNLEASLYGAPRRHANAPARVAPRGTLGLKRRSADPSPPPPPSRPRPVAPASGKKTPAALSITVFYRSLATMVEAGVPLSRALDTLATHESDRALRGILGEVASQVHTGSSLSQAMRAYPSAFAAVYVQLVRVAERTGSLHSVLPRMAEYREKWAASELRLRQALTYPALVLVLCLLMLTLGPAFVLRGQMELLSSSGQALPWLTRLFVALSGALQNPWLAATVLLGPALAAAAGLSWVTPERRYGWASRVPGLGNLLLSLTISRFAATLSLAYRVGLPIHEALALAAAASGNPLLAAEQPAMLDRLHNGDTLARSLAASAACPPTLVRMVEAGEEAGKVEELLAWVASLYELELDTSMARFLSLIEPILLLGMAILVALVLLATLLPMVRLLGTL